MYLHMYGMADLGVPHRKAKITTVAFNGLPVVDVFFVVLQIYFIFHPSLCCGLIKLPQVFCEPMWHTMDK
jgi:biopolymer transport protein ExbD